MNKNLLCLCGAALAVGTLSAQKLQEGYVKFPQSTMLHSYVQQWNGGAGTISVDGVTWEDEEFFTSRVKPRARVTATTMNIYDFGSKAGRRSLWWVPIGYPETQALPNGSFEEEVFSMWSYLDHYGNWTAPFGWVTAAMADAAHKNGVAVSGVCSIPNAALSGDWYTSMSTLGTRYGSDSGAETIGKFLYYHGVDGLGYNSEFYTNSTVVSNLMNMHNGLMKYMKDKNAIFENIWYDGTTESGGISFDSFLVGKTNIYKGASIFSNYNWVNSSSMASATTKANSVTDPNGTARGPWWNYAGMDQQGGQPRSGANYPTLAGQDWSMGWWGAHSYNMFWEGRGSYGSSAEAVQEGYIKTIEQFFGNGPRNPAIKKAIATNRSHRPSDDFHGVSAFINERSALTHALSTEPFYTFFNIGNGKFFNWKGERVSDNEWYSLGIQDYLPTWRWWFAPTWLQKDVTAGTVSLNASFTYEDAYVGGSCLKIEGTASTEYLHLFKADMSGLNSKRITVRYKLLNGEGDVRLIITGTANPGTEADVAKNLQLFTVAESSDVQNNSYKEGADGWVTKTFDAGATWGSSKNIGNVGVIGLEFKNAKDMELLVGEISIMPKSNTATPATPTVRSSKVLANVYTGVDGKIIWTMDGDAARQAGTPKYNSDVNASMYKVWAREEGGEAKFLGMTTSWGAVGFRAPNTDSSKKIQFGVSAVSADTRSESEIAWGSLLAKGEYQQSNDIAISKMTIKPNEDFEVYYVDPMHSSSTWTILNQSGTVMASGTGTSLSVPEGLPEWGGYDLVLDRGTANERTFGYFIQISDDKVGAMPVVYDLAADNNTVTESTAPIKITLADEPVLSYTGRKADGSASRALNLNSRYIGTKVEYTGLADKTGSSFSVAGWFRFNAIPNASWNFMNVSNKLDSWPYNTWGWAWNHGDSNGRIFCTFRGAASDGGSPGELHYTFPDTKLQAGVWTHIAWTISYTSEGFRCQLFINGVKQPSRVFQYATGNSGSCRPGLEKDTTPMEDGSEQGKTDGDTYVSGQTHPISANDYIYFGGAAHGGAAIDGIVDDFQIWGKAMDVNDVKKSMAGFDASNLPDDVICLWDFESEADSDGSFSAIGSKAGAKGFSYEVGYQDNNPENPGEYQIKTPSFDSGCPFLSGTAYPVVTTANWKDSSDRRTVFTKQSARAAEGEDESGAAKVTFKTAGDHYVSLTLENAYGASTKSFPVYEVSPAPASIDGVEADGSLKTYTVENTLFLEFAEGGVYNVQVYNAAGMLSGNETLNAAAGQSARVDLGTAGVYVVKVVKDGQVLRTLKVLSK